MTGALRTAYGGYPDLSGVRRALVIKLRHHGDVLLSSPVFTNLRAAIPGAAIDALVNEESRAMLEGHPAIASVLGYDRKWKQLGWLGRVARELGLMAEIRRRRYDLVINLTEGDRGALMGWLSGARLRVGIEHPYGFIGKNRLFTHQVKRTRTPRHTVERDLDTLRVLGIFPTLERRALSLHVPREAEDKARALLPGGGYAVIHAVSRWRFKCWPLDKVAAVAKAFTDRGWPVALTASGDPVEVAMVDEVVRQLGAGWVVSLAGKTSLTEMAAVVRQARCLVSVDSLPVHMASAFGTPLVALFGPSNDKIWGPWMHPRSRVVSLPYSCRPCGLDGCGGSKVSDCLENLPVAAVLQAVDEVMGADAAIKRA